MYMYTTKSNSKPELFRLYGCELVLNTYTGKEGNTTGALLKTEHARLRRLVGLGVDSLKKSSASGKV